MYAVIVVGICITLISNCMASGVSDCPQKEGNGEFMNASEKFYVYIGTYTHAESRGIYFSMLDMDNGSLTDPVLAAEIKNPGFLRYESVKDILYCTGNPQGEGDLFCSVAGLKIDRSNGKLTRLNSQTENDLSCCHISCGMDGGLLFGADYGHAKAAVFELDSKGRISPAAEVLKFEDAGGANPARQSEPHVHSINPDISGQYVIVCDFSADKIKVYRIDADTKKLKYMSSVCMAAGSGPRHLVCHPNGRYIYVINELNGTIAAFDFYDGELKQRQVIETLPPDFKGDNTTAEIAISTDEHFLYASNRGHDSISYYSIDPENGILSLQGFVSTEGEHPRNFTIDPSGRFMLVSNRDSNNVAVFRLDNDSGMPVYTGNRITVSVPMCISIIKP